MTIVDVNLTQFYKNTTINWVNQTGLCPMQLNCIKLSIG